MNQQHAHRTPEREWIYRSLNPWASIGVLGEPIEDEKQRITGALRRMGNPYAKLSVQPQDEDEGDPRQTETDVASHQHGTKIHRRGVNKVTFQKMCRDVFRQYEPLDSRRKTLRPEFRAFIEENGNKSAVTRAAILDDLMRYHLGDNLQPHLNRERPADLAAKLKKISEAHPE